MQINRAVFAAALAALAANCAKVDPPTAIITAQQSVNSGTLVVLDGTKSTDPQSRPLAYTWSFQSRPAGSNAAIQDPQAAKTSFMADVAGDYLVALLVSNSAVNSAMVPMTITASPCGTSAPNVANLRFAPEAPVIGSTVQFAADASDPDNAAGCAQGQTLSYSWTLIGMPAGSTASLNNAAASSPSLLADVAGAYSAQLVVTDSTGRSSKPQTLAMTVRNCGGATPKAAPTATPASTPPGQPVTLNAHGSDDDTACGVAQTLTYVWSVVSRPAGSSAVVISPTDENPTFTPDVAGSYELSVQVSDGPNGHRSLAFVKVDATHCGEAAPVVDQINAKVGASPVTDVTEGDLIQVSANSVTDSNCLANPAGLAYSWTLTKPSGSTASLDNPFSASPSFVPQGVETYVVALVVTNTAHFSSTSVFKQLRVFPLPVKPAISAPANVTVGGSYSASVATRAGMTYVWSSGTATISSPHGTAGEPSADGTTNSITFTAPSTAGSLTLGCAEKNGIGITSTQGTATVNVAAAPAAPGVNAPPTNVTSGLSYSASVTARTGMTYKWTVGNAAITSPNGTAGALITFTAGTAGVPLTIAVTETNAAGDSATSGTTSLTVWPPSVACSITAQANVTAGTSFTASSPTQTGATYAWQVGGTSVTPTTGSGTTSISQTAPGTPGPLSIRCDATNGAGDSTVTASVTITVVPVAAPPTILVPDAVGGNVTSGLTYTASVTVRAGMTYFWSAGSAAITSAGGAAGVLSGGTSSITFVASSAGPLTIGCTETNAAGAASSQGSTNLTVVAPPGTPQVTLQATNLTAGSASTADVVGNTGNSFHCTATNATITGGTDSGAFASTAHVQFTAGSPGALTINCTASNAANTVSQAGTASGTVWAAAATPAISAPASATSGRVYTASVQTHRGAHYTWSIDAGGTISSAGGVSGVFSGDGSTNSILFTSGSVGTRTLTVTETNGANDSGTPRTATVNVVPEAATPAITNAPAAATSRKTYTATVVARTGFTYSWTMTRFPLGGGTLVQSTTLGINTVTFSPDDIPDGTTGLLALTCTETNAAGDSSASSLAVTVFVYPAPRVPDLTLTANGSPVASGDDVTAGDALHSSIVLPQAGMTFAWSATNGAPSSQAGGTAFDLTGTNTDVGGNAVTLTLTVSATNGNHDSATRIATLHVFPRPSAPVVTLGLPPDANITAGRHLHASIGDQAGMTFSWTAVNGNPSSQSSGTTFDLTATNTDVNGNAVNLTVTATAHNAIGATASGNATLQVYPRPIAPVVLIKDAGNNPLSEGANVTVGDQLHASIGSQAGITFSWTAVNGNPTSQSGGTTFDLTGTNTDVDGNPVTLAVTATAHNAIGATASGQATLQVYPRPTAPTVLIKDAGNNPLSEGANVTAGDQLHASTTSQAGMTFTWTAVNGNPTTQSSGTTFDLTGTNADPAGNAVTLTVTATAHNFLGAIASGSATLQVYPRPAAPTVALADGTGGPIASGADATAGSFQATTNDQVATITYAWTITPTGNRSNVAGDTTAHVTFDASANADNTPATVTVKIEVSNGIGLKDSSTATLIVHPTQQTPKIHIVGPDGNDGLVTQCASGVKAQVDARAHMHYAWTYSMGSFNNSGGAAGDLTGDGLHNFVQFSVPTGATTILLTCKEFNDIAAASAAGERQATVVPAPGIFSFAPDPLFIYAGGASLLSWSFTGGTGSIDQGVGALSGNNGATLVTNITTQPTPFTLTVTNAANTTAISTKTVSVTTPTGWESLNSAGPPDTIAAGAYSLTFDPFNATTLYAATTSAGVLKMTLTSPWASTGFPDATPSFGVTVGYPDAALSLWSVVDANGTLYHFTDVAGWQLVTGPDNGLPAPTASPASPPDIRLDPSDPTQKRLYVSFNAEGLFRSDNDGINWAKVRLPSDPTILENTAPTRLAIAPNGTLFVGTDGAANPAQLFRVSGTTAELLPLFDASGVSALATDPEGNVVVVGHGSGQVESVTATDPFSFNAGEVLCTGSPCAATAVQGLAFAFDGTTDLSGTALSGSVYAVAGNAVFRSIDLGLSFTDAKTASGGDILDSAYNSVTPHPKRATTVYVLGTDSGIFQRTFGAPAP